jgi:hypothetical protein
MAFTYKDIQDEIKRRALRNQSGTEYDEEIKNIINTSIFRISREANWRPLRRKTYFTTKSSYISGTNFVSVTNSSTAFSLISTACDLWTDKIEVGRRIKFGSDSWYYTIRAINSNTNGVIDMAYRGTTATRTTYEIYPQEEYNLPIQVDHRAFLWHEDYGYPFKMFYIPDQTFFDTSVDLVEKGTPTHYRMWGEDTIMAQPPTATPLMIVSTSNTDTTVYLTITGNVSGYPLSENIKLNGTTTSRTGYEFESVERISKDLTTLGRVVVTSSRGSYTIAVLPAGDTTATIKYSKVQLYPLPNRNFDINVYYYKEPYRLVNDDDIHELGQGFDESIILLSVAKIKYQDSQTEGDRWFQLYEDEIKNLKKTNVDKIDWIPTLQRPNEVRQDPYVTKTLMYRQVGGKYGPRG